MAEIKRASPSKGDIAPSTSAPAQALLYALSGASVISVLTEPHWFRGSLTDLAAARQAVSHLPNRPAILRKDFILDEYQIAEARIHGADTVLLIVAMLPLHRLKALYMYSLTLGMEPLVEVNNPNEMLTALKLGAKVIGVNNRNLHDFIVDMGTTSRLADMVRDKDVILCALSGISSPADVQRYTAQGIGAILVGEALMRARDTRAFIRTLLSLEPPTQPDPSPIPFVKICGIRTAAEADFCASAGADMLGLMFVPSSKRVISLSTAQEISSAVRGRRFSYADSPSTDSPHSSTPIPWFTTHARAFPTGRPLLVGVFQNQPLEYILHAISFVQLDMVQFHGSEPVEWANFVPVPIIKVFAAEAASIVNTVKSEKVETEQTSGVVQSGQAPAEPSQYLTKYSHKTPSLFEITRPGYHQFILLDSISQSSGLSGGSGEPVDWGSARRIVDAGEFIVDRDLVDEALDQSLNGGDKSASATYAPFPLPIILAGGLTPSNVADAIAQARPWAVDVSGGVEDALGTGKDAEKVLAFIKAAKGFKRGEVNGEAVHDDSKGDVDA
jgi:anthranilate synthase/indole-3-glycerol phosphate synthase/phosphoribosylanthranilate isomerase